MSEILDTDETRLMLRLEADIHRKGWDVSPSLHTIQRVHNRLRLLEQPVPWHVVDHPGHLLKVMADDMSEPSEWGELIAQVMARLDGFHGLLFAHEAWTNSLSPSERGDRSLADIPGSRELRGVIAVTVFAKIYYVSRIRGEKPRVDRFDEVGGRVPNALYRMIQAVARHMPDDAVDRQALADVVILDDNGIEANIQARRQKAAGQ